MVGTDRALALSFLGPPVVERGGTRLRISRRKVIGLLAYLAVTGSRQSRDRLAELLYPGHDRDRAYSDLRQTLTHLRNAIGGQWLDSDRDSVSLAERTGLWIDVREFQSRAREIEAGAPTALSMAAGLVRGPFLSGFYLKDSPEFEEWQSSESEALRRNETLILDRLVSVCEDHGEYAEAVAACRRLIALDPLEEGAHRRLMFLCARAGRRSAALTEYQRLRSALRKELDVEPSQETEDLRRRIEEGSVRAPRKVPRARAPAASPDFVGRGPELERIAGARNDAAGGRGRLVVVMGEAGIGKTRLIEEATSISRVDGTRVVWGRCHDDSGLPPFWPWRQALGELARGEPGDRLRRWAGGRAAVLAELVQDLQQPLGNPPAPPRLDNPESERFRLSEAVALFLEAAAVEQRLILVLEDLHWADVPSLGLLEFVARGLARSSILILASARELDAGHRLAQALGELSRERSFIPLALRPLEREEVMTLAERSTAAPMAPALGEILWDKTRGNPLFVVEYLRAMGAPGEKDGQPVIPSNIRAVIGRRLAHLSGACHKTLQVAAALGAEFPSDLLAACLGTSARELLSLLDEALSARVVLEPSDRGASFRFSHPLVRETLLTELTGAMRTEVHARIAACLEERYGEQSPRFASELAAHLALAQPLAPAAKLARYSLLAGEQRLAARAFDDALRHFRVGLGVTPPSVNDEATAWLRFGLAQALYPVTALPHQPHELAEGDEALQAIVAAYDWFDAAGDLGAAVRVAEYPIVHMHPGTGRIDALYDRALTRVPPGSLEAGRLLALKGQTALYASGDPVAAGESLHQAAAIARGREDHLLELRTAALLAARAVDCEPPAAGWALVRRCRELLRDVDDPAFECEIYLRAYHFSLISGDLREARAYIGAHAATAARLRRSYGAEGTRMTNLMELEVAWICGEWNQARRASDCALDAEGGHTWILRHHIGLRALLEFELGYAEAGESFLGRFLSALDNDHPLSGEMTIIAGTLVWIARATGKRELLERVRAILGSVPNDYDRFGVLALMAATEGNVEAARTCRPQAEYRHPNDSPTFGPTRQELLGLLDRVLGELDSAVTHFEAAMARHRAAGLKPLLARCLCECAQTLLIREGPGDRHRATAQAREAQGIADALGMRLLAERIRSLAAR